MSVGKNKRLRHQAVKRASPGGVSIHRQNKMFSRNLSVPDFMRRFFVSCTQISEAYAVREYTPPEQIRKELLYHVFHYIIEKPEND